MGNAAVRVPVSMRLPAEITSEIDAFAEKANMRKTDAYLHFLRLGLESEGKRDERDRLSAMEARIDEILALVKGERASEGAAADAIARVSEAVATIAAGYPAIREAYLFGSMARGTFTDESDIDLRLVVDREKGFNLHDLEQWGGEHHYTLDTAERDLLIAAGWTDEGLGWYSDPGEAVPVYREYNPNQFSCNHNYTTSKEEHDGLAGIGWHDEGIAWYGV